jgi:hypothetical protein
MPVSLIESESESERPQATAPARRSRWGGRETAAAVVVLAVALGSMGWAVLRLRPARVVSAAPVATGTWETFHQRPPGQIEVRHPSTWRVQDFGFECPTAAAHGVIVSNLDRDLHNVSGGGHCSSSLDMRGLPPQLVVVRLWHLVTFGNPSNDPDTPLPLDLADARESSGKDREDPEQPYGAPTPILFMDVVHGGHPYVLQVFLGPQASVRDREIARRIVASIGFREEPTPTPVTGSSPSPGAPDGWVTFTDRGLSLSVGHPAGWYAQSFRVFCRYNFLGVVVSNVAHRFRARPVKNGCGSALDLRGLPPDHVVVIFTSWNDNWHVEGALPVPIFPLEISEFKRFSSPGGPPGDVEYALLNRIQGEPYSVQVWFGPQASAADRATAGDILRSFTLAPASP